ncbi:uncharacterized protein LOC141854951 [Brevipalpus obovatus]|uniref:uncharacterized protein LOC141854951 n=1 Tax=Brevipalpus obovatus TaxID=246614 RepID=UPI003D9DDA93
MITKQIGEENSVEGQTNNIQKNFNGSSSSEMFPIRNSNQYHKKGHIFDQTRIQVLTITLGALCLFLSNFEAVFAGPTESHRDQKDHKEETIIAGICKSLKFVAGQKNYEQYRAASKRCVEEHLPAGKKDAMKCPQVVKFYSLNKTSDIEQFCNDKDIKHLVDDCVLKNGIKLSFLVEAEECMMKKLGQTLRMLS